MKIDPYIMLDGKCDEAFEHYAKCLHGKIVMKQTFGDSPARDHVPADAHGRVIHVRLEAGDQTLMGSDTTSEHPHEGNNGFAVSVNVDSAEEAKRIFDSLGEGGKVTMPLGKTFWAESFGMFEDRFGVSWMVNYQKA
jgi:PhnB protein